jgi:hypothetical protein
VLGAGVVDGTACAVGVGPPAVPAPMVNTVYPRTATIKTAAAPTMVLA